MGEPTADDLLRPERQRPSPYTILRVRSRSPHHTRFFHGFRSLGQRFDPIGVRLLADRRDLPLVGGSDAHYPIEIARSYTGVEADELTPESIVDAILHGRVRAVVDTSSSREVLRRAYRFLHSRKGWLERSEWDPLGLGTPPGEEQV